MFKKTRVGSLNFIINSSKSLIMLHPNSKVQLINKDKGFGVVATSFIAKGTFTWVQDSLDRVFTRKQYQAFSDSYKDILDTYTFRNKKGQYVLFWDNARFVNHSFNSNCLSSAYDFEIAIRDIQEGEELTDDYGYLNIKEPFKGIEEGSKRKYVYPNDLTKYYKVWDKKLFSAIKYVELVEQPLKEYIPKQNWRIAIEIARGIKSMESILSLYYKD